MSQKLDSSTFRVEHDQADRVYLTGDFNRWDIPGVPMTRVARNRWEIALPRPVAGIVAAAVIVGGRVSEVMPVRVPELKDKPCIDIYSPSRCAEEEHHDLIAV